MRQAKLWDKDSAVPVTVAVEAIATGHEIKAPFVQHAEALPRAAAAWARSTPILGERNGIGVVVRFAAAIAPGIVAVVAVPILCAPARGRGGRRHGTHCHRDFDDGADMVACHAQLPAAGIGPRRTGRGHTKSCVVGHVKGIRLPRIDSAPHALHRPGAQRVGGLLWHGVQMIAAREQQLPAQNLHRHRRVERLARIDCVAGDAHNLNVALAGRRRLCGQRRCRRIGGLCRAWRRRRCWLGRRARGGGGQ